MSVLITGAGGFIGRHLVAALPPDRDIWAVGHDTVPADRGRTRWISADLASETFVSALPPRADTVVHLAQSRYYRDFPERATDIFAVNVASTARLLDWAQRARVRRFILASSGGANRAASATGLSYYLSSKRTSELLAQSYGSHFAVVVLRFFFVYGAGQRRSMLIPRLVESVRDGRPITLAGEHGLRLNPVHVGDAVRAIVRANDVDSGEFDVAGPEVLTLRAIADTIGGKLGRTPQYVVDHSARPDDVVGDIAAMSDRLAAPRVTFEQGIDDVLGVLARSHQQ